VRAVALALVLCAAAPARAADPFRLDRPYAFDPTVDPGNPIPGGLPTGNEPYAYNGGRSSAVALMIAGGATFLGGLVIGKKVGTVIAVVGLGVGAYGTYLYFR
jgi:hypothetical protein